VNQFVLAPVPVDGIPDGNEHRLSVPECLMLRRVIVVELREDVLARLRAAVPELTPSGNKCALGRAPTDDEVARLRAAAEWYGFPLVATVRTNEAYANERRLWAASGATPMVLHRRQRAPPAGLRAAYICPCQPRSPGLPS